MIECGFEVDKLSLVKELLLSGENIKEVSYRIFFVCFKQKSATLGYPKETPFSQCMWKIHANFQGDRDKGSGVLGKILA